MKKSYIILIIVALSILLGACATSGREESGKLTVGIMPDVDSVPFIIAQEKGFFQEEGLTVTIVPFKSALDRDSALQSGKLDGVVSDMLAVAFAKDGGFNAVITSLTSGSYKLVVSKQETAASVKELKNKEVAISKNTIIEFMTDKMMTENGLTPDDIHKIVIPQIPSRLEMLNNGKVSAAVLPDPLATVAVKNGAKMLSSSDEMKIKIGVMMFTSQAVGQKEKEIRAMYRAYDKAVEYLSKQPMESYIDLVIEKGGFPKSVKGALVLPTYSKALAPERKDIAEIVKWLQEKRLIKRMYTYEEMVDSRFTR